VFGVPDETWGERVHAAIVLKEGHSVTVEEFKQFCKKHIADYKCPREFSFHKREDFPRDAAGKIRKRLLREPHWKKLQSRL
jgi:acyl-CoA synthetase (AMP-forming)/AMP-acid ligase II